MPHKADSIEYYRRCNYQRCLEYIHMNPVKRGYVDVPEHWRYSSARSYMGENGVVEGGGYD